MPGPIRERLDAKAETRQASNDNKKQPVVNPVNTGSAVNSSLSFNDRATWIHSLTSRTTSLQAQFSADYPSLKTLISDLVSVVLDELVISLREYNPQIFALYENYPSVSQDLQQLLNKESNLEERLSLANGILKTVGIEAQSEIIEFLKLITQLNLTVNQLTTNYADIETIQTLTIQIQTLLHTTIIYNQLNPQLLNIITTLLNTTHQLTTVFQAFQQLPDDANYTDYFNVLAGVSVIEPIVHYVQGIIGYVIEQYKNVTDLYQNLKALYQDTGLLLTEKIKRIIILLETNDITTQLTEGHANYYIDYLRLSLDIYDKAQTFLQSIKGFESSEGIFQGIKQLIEQVELITKQIEKIGEIREYPYLKTLQYNLHQVKLGVGIAQTLEEVEPDTSYQQYFANLVNHPDLNELIPASSQPLLKLAQTLNHYWLQAKNISQFKEHPEYKKLQDYFNSYPIKGNNNQKLIWLAEGFNQGLVINLIAPYLPNTITTQLQKVYTFQVAIRDFPLHATFLQQSIWALEKLGTQQLSELTSGVGVDQTSLDLLYELLKAYDQQSSYKNVTIKLLSNVLANERLQQQLVKQLFTDETGQYAALATGIVQETVKLYQQNTFSKSWSEIYKAFFDVLLRQSKQSPLTKDIARIVEDIKELGSNIGEQQWQQGFYTAFSLATNPKISSNLAFAKGIYNLLQVFYKSYRVWVNASNSVNIQENTFKELTTSIQKFADIREGTLESKLIDLINYLPTLNEVANQYRKLPTTPSWLQWIDQLTNVLITSKSSYIKTTYQTFNQQLGKWIAQQLKQAPQTLQEVYGNLPVINNEATDDTETLNNLPWLEISFGLSGLLLSSYGAYQAYQSFQASSLDQPTADQQQATAELTADQSQQGSNLTWRNAARRMGQAAPTFGLSMLFNLINSSEALPLPSATTTDLPSTSSESFNDNQTEQLPEWDLPPLSYLLVGGASTGLLTYLTVMKLRRALQRTSNQPSEDVELAELSSGLLSSDRTTVNNLQQDIEETILDIDRLQQQQTANTDDSENELEIVTQPLMASSSEVITLGEEIGETSDDDLVTGSRWARINQSLPNKERLGWILASLFALGGLGYSGYGIYRHYARANSQTKEAGDSLQEQYQSLHSAEFQSILTAIDAEALDRESYLSSIRAQEQQRNQRIAQVSSLFEQERQKHSNQSNQTALSDSSNTSYRRSKRQVEQQLTTIETTSSPATTTAQALTDRQSYWLNKAQQATGKAKQIYEELATGQRLGEPVVAPVESFPDKDSWYTLVSSLNLVTVSEINKSEIRHLLWKLANIATTTSEEYSTGFVDLLEFYMQLDANLLSMAIFATETSNSTSAKEYKSIVDNTYAIIKQFEITHLEKVNQYLALREADLAQLEQNLALLTAGNVIELNNGFEIIDSQTSISLDPDSVTTTFTSESTTASTTVKPTTTSKPISTKAPVVPKPAFDPARSAYWSKRILSSHGQNNNIYRQLASGRRDPKTTFAPLESFPDQDTWFTLIYLLNIGQYNQAYQKELKDLINYIADLSSVKLDLTSRTLVNLVNFYIRLDYELINNAIDDYEEGLFVTAYYHNSVHEDVEKILDDNFYTLAKEQIDKHYFAIYEKRQVLTKIRLFQLKGLTDEQIIHFEDSDISMPEAEDRKDGNFSPDKISVAFTPAVPKEDIPNLRKPDTLINKIRWKKFSEGFKQQMFELMKSLANSEETQYVSDNNKVDVAKFYIFFDKMLTVKQIEAYQNSNWDLAKELGKLKKILQRIMVDISVYVAGVMNYLSWRKGDQAKIIEAKRAARKQQRKAERQKIKQSKANTTEQTTTATTTTAATTTATANTPMVQTYEEELQNVLLQQTPAFFSVLQSLNNPIMEPEIYTANWVKNTINTHITDEKVRNRTTLDTKVKAHYIDSSLGLVPVSIPPDAALGDVPVVPIGYVDKEIIKEVTLRDIATGAYIDRSNPDQEVSINWPVELLELKGSFENSTLQTDAFKELENYNTPSNYSNFITASNVFGRMAAHRFLNDMEKSKISSADPAVKAVQAYLEGKRKPLLVRVQRNSLQADVVPQVIFIPVLGNNRVGVMLSLTGDSSYYEVFSPGLAAEYGESSFEALFTGGNVPPLGIERQRGFQDFILKHMSVYDNMKHQQETIFGYQYFQTEGDLGSSTDVYTPPVSTMAVANPSSVLADAYFRRLHSDYDTLNNSPDEASLARLMARIKYWGTVIGSVLIGPAIIGAIPLSVAIAAGLALTVLTSIIPSAVMLNEADTPAMKQQALTEIIIAIVGEAVAQVGLPVTFSILKKVVATTVKGILTGSKQFFPGLRTEIYQSMKTLINKIPVERLRATGSNVAAQANELARDITNTLERMVAESEIIKSNAARDSLLDQLQALFDQQGYQTSIRVISRWEEGVQSIAKNEYVIVGTDSEANYTFVAKPTESGETTILNYEDEESWATNEASEAKKTDTTVKYRDYATVSKAKKATGGEATQNLTDTDHIEGGTTLNASKSYRESIGQQQGVNYEEIQQFYNNVQEETINNLLTEESSAGVQNAQFPNFDLANTIEVLPDSTDTRSFKIPKLIKSTLNLQNTVKNSLNPQWQVRGVMLEENTFVEDQNMYRVRPAKQETANDWNYYIKQDDSVYQIRWDDYKKVWRLVNPRAPGRFNYALPIRLNEENRWEVSFDLPGAGGAKGKLGGGDSDIPLKRQKVEEMDSGQVESKSIEPIKVSIDLDRLDNIPEPGKKVETVDVPETQPEHVESIKVSIDLDRLRNQKQVTYRGTEITAYEYPPELSNDALIETAVSTIPADQTSMPYIEESLISEDRYTLPLAGYQHSVTENIDSSVELSDSVSKTMKGSKVTELADKFRTQGVWNFEEYDLVPQILSDLPEFNNLNISLEIVQLKAGSTDYNLKPLNEYIDTTIEPQVFGRGSNKIQLVYINRNHYAAVINGMIEDVPPDGDCFFYAVDKSLENLSKTNNIDISSIYGTSRSGSGVEIAKALRERVASQFENNIDQYRPFITSLPNEQDLVSDFALINFTDEQGKNSYAVVGKLKENNTIKYYYYDNKSHFGKDNDALVYEDIDHLMYALEKHYKNLQPKTVEVTNYTKINKDSILTEDQVPDIKVDMDSVPDMEVAKEQVPDIEVDKDSAPDTGIDKGQVLETDNDQVSQIETDENLPLLKETKQKYQKTSEASFKTVPLDDPRIEDNAKASWFMLAVENEALNSDPIRSFSEVAEEFLRKYKNPRTSKEIQQKMKSVIMQSRQGRYTYPNPLLPEELRNFKGLNNIDTEFAATKARLLDPSLADVKGNPLEYMQQKVERGFSKYEMDIINTNVIHSEGDYRTLSSNKKYNAGIFKMGIQRAGISDDYSTDTYHVLDPYTGTYSFNNFDDFNSWFKEKSNYFKGKNDGYMYGASRYRINRIDNSNFIPSLPISGFVKNKDFDYYLLYLLAKEAYVDEQLTAALPEAIKRLKVKFDTDEAFVKESLEGTRYATKASEKNNNILAPITYRQIPNIISSVGVIPTESIDGVIGAIRYLITNIKDDLKIVNISSYPSLKDIARAQARTLNSYSFQQVVDTATSAKKYYIFVPNQGIASFDDYEEAFQWLKNTMKTQAKPDEAYGIVPYHVQTESRGLELKGIPKPKRPEKPLFQATSYSIQKIDESKKLVDQLRQFKSFFNTYYRKKLPSGAAGVMFGKDMKSTTIQGFSSSTGLAQYVGMNAHPVVKKLYEEVPIASRSWFHARCVETDVLSKLAYKVKAKSVDDLKKAVKGVRSSVYSIGSGNYMAPCNSCRSVLSRLGIDAIPLEKIIPNPDLP